MLEQLGWNAVMQGSAEARRHASEQDEEAFDEEDRDEADWDDSQDDGDADDWDDQPSKSRSGGKAPARRRKKASQRRQDDREQARDERFRRKLLLNYGLPLGAGLVIVIVVILFNGGKGGGGRPRPGPRDPRPVPRDVARPRVDPAVRERNRNRPVAAAQKKTEDVIVSERGQLRLLHDSGRLSSGVSNLELAPDGALVAGEHDRKVCV